MVPPEFHNNPPQEVLPSVDKTAIPENSSELKLIQLDLFKPHASALLGLTPHGESSPNGQTIRKERYDRWKQDGYIPPIAGGSERKVPIAPEELLKLYKEGISVQELAYRFKVSHRTIYKYLHKGGIDEFWYAQVQKQADDHRRDQAIGLGLDENSTWPEIFAFLDQRNKRKLEETQ